MADHLQNSDSPSFFPPPYEFLGELGRGGMGVVYRAFDPNRQEEVAIKLLPEGSVDQQVARRFQREVTQLATLSHQNIVAFFDSGTFAGRDFLVMELIKGGNLGDVLMRRGGHLGWIEAVKLFIQVAVGLGHIHDQGYVHRDFKPENLLVTAEGIPKITDFGLARKLEDRSRLTSDGTIVGTYSYLAPEQVMSSSVGPTADIYALGCCLYLTLTGQPVFKGEAEFALLNSHLREIPVAPRSFVPEIPTELDALVCRMLKKPPDERPQSAREVAKILRGILQKHVPSSNQYGHSVLGRQQDLADLERLCELRPDVGFCCLFVAPNGFGRSVLTRAWVSAQRSRGLKVFTAIPSAQDLFPLNSVYRGLAGEEQPFVQALAHQGVGAAVDLLVKALTDFPEPAVIVADDFMRMSQTTNLILQELCKREPPPNRGWLLSCGMARAAGLTPWPGSQRFELPPLDNDSMLEIGARILGGALDEGLADFVLKRSAGSVRKLRHNLCSLQSQGAIQLMEIDAIQRWVLNASVKLSSGIYESIVADLEKESSGRYRLLRTACFLQEPFLIQAAIVAAGLSEQEGDVCVDLLLNQGLLEESWGAKGELFYVSSQEVKQLITQVVNERTSRRIHGKIIEQNICQSSSEVALHEVFSGLGVEALGSVERASLELEQVGGYLESAELWHETYPALSSTETAEIRWKVSLKTAQALYVAGRVDEARECCQAVLSESPPNQDGPGLRYFQDNFGLAVYLEYCRLEDSPSTMRKFLSKFGSQQAKAGETNLFFAVAMASAYEQINDIAGLTSALDGLGTLSIQTQLMAPFAYYRLRSYGLRKLGRPKDALEILEARGQYLCRTSPEDQNELVREKVLCLQQLGQFADAKLLLEQQIRVCSNSQLFGWEAEFWMLLGLGYRLTAQPDEALQSFEQATSVCPKGGDLEARVLFELGFQRLLRGEARPAELALRSCISSTGGASQSGPAGFCLGWLCLKNARWTECEDWLDQVSTRQDRGSVDPDVSWGQMAQVYHCEAQRLQGHTQEALSRIDRLDTSLVLGTFTAWASANIRSRCLGQPEAELGLAQIRQLQAYHTSFEILLADDWVSRESTGLPSPSESVVVPVKLMTSSDLVSPPNGAQTADWESSGLIPPNLDSSSPNPNDAKGVQTDPRVLTNETSPSHQSPVEPPVKPLSSKPLTEVQAPEVVSAAVSVAPVLTPAMAKDPGRRKLMFAGVALGGCAVLSGVLLLGKSMLGGPTLTPSPSLTPTASATEVASIVIDTVPDRAELVLFDPSGKEVSRGTAPLKVPELLLDGEYCLNTTLKGYESGQFRFRGGSSLTGKTFELAPAMCRLRLHFEPRPVQLVIDSEKAIEVGTSTFEKELRVGSHKLVATKSGYLPWTKTIELKATSVVELPDIRLQQEGGRLKLTCQPEALRIYVDGKQMAVTKAKGPKAGLWEGTLKPGKHSLKLTKDGYQTKELSLKVEPGKTINKSVKLDKIVEVPIEAPYYPPTRPSYQPQEPYYPPRPYNPPPRPMTRPDDV